MTDVTTATKSAGDEPAIAAPNTQPTTAKVQPVPSRSAFVSFVFDLALTVVIATAVAIAVWKFAPVLLPADTKAADDLPFYVVNVDELTREQILTLGQMVRSGAIEMDEMPVKSAVFGKALIEQLQSYADEGKVVLRSDSVISAPANIENITQKVRDRLVQSGAMLTLPIAKQ